MTPYPAPAETLKLLPESTPVLRFVYISGTVAFCYVTMKPNSQKNDVHCEYTCGAPQPLLLQIPINI